MGKRLFAVFFKNMFEIDGEEVQEKEEEAAQLQSQEPLAALFGTGWSRWNHTGEFFTRRMKKV